MQKSLPLSFCIEIEDFLDEDECDLLIELAKRKQMRPHVDRGTNNIIQDGPEKTFYSWDLNDDGFIDKEEVICCNNFCYLK